MILMTYFVVQWHFTSYHVSFFFLFVVVGEMMMVDLDMFVPGYEGLTYGGVPDRCVHCAVSTTDGRSLMKDVEAVTERLQAAEVTHSQEMQEQQRCSSDLQERLVETRAQKEEVRMHAPRVI